MSKVNITIHTQVFEENSVEVLPKLVKKNSEEVTPQWYRVQSM